MKGQEVARIKRLVEEIGKLLDNGNYALGAIKVDTLMFIANIDENRLGIAEGYNFKGIMADDNGKYTEALSNYSRAIDIFKANGLTEREAGIYNNIGKIYKTLNEDKTALSYYFKAANIYKIDDKNNNLRITYNNIGTCYQMLGQYQSAKHYLYLSLGISKRINDSLYSAMAYHNIGVNHQAQNKHDSALHYFDMSLKFLKDVAPGILVNYKEIGHTWFGKGNLDSSEKYLKAAESIIKKGVSSENWVDITRYLALVYEKKGAYEKAFYYLKKNKYLEDSINRQSYRTDVIKSEMEKTYADEKMKQEFQKRAAENDSQNKKRLLNYTLIALFISIVLVIISLRSYLQKRKANFIISKQKEIVEFKNKEITDSINYAKRIQNAQLTSPLYISEYVSEHFIYYKPRDIVSGDFYWALKQDDVFYVVVGDCTGHGVPGAFMSLLNINLLNEIIIERKIRRPDLVLNEIRREIIKTLKNESEDVEIRDGMDCVICAFNFADMKLEYACANNKFFVARNDELIISFTSKMPVGRSHDDSVPFKLFEMPVEKGDVFYFTTDGYIGQFGGVNNKKFKYSRLEQKLLEISHLMMSKQHKLIEQTFDNWKGEYEQVDDVCVVGIKI
jgi:serine phosphatase RsbU (regulator of sigma subunit)